MTQQNNRPGSLLSAARACLLAGGLMLAVLPVSAFGQENNAEPQSTVDQSTGGFSMPNLWDLAVQGGWFMVPIGIASIVTVVFTLERWVGLRRGRILPRALIRKLREQLLEGSLDPRKVWEACLAHPSPLANAVKAAVLKTGRPHAEVEKAVEDAVGRETLLMTRNLRPINVVASIAPLLGLLGTVQGMIMAFMVTSTTSSTGTAKAQELAHGIYTALVTTFAGLCVAVISVLLANLLEGRIEKTLRKMESIFLDLLPQLERFEGRLRVSQGISDEDLIVKLKRSGGPASSDEHGDVASSGSLRKAIQPPIDSDKGRRRPKVAAND